MRVFIAINFEADILDKIDAIAQQICRHTSQGRFTERERLHLTLCFLGERSREEIDLIKVCIRDVEQPPFALKLNAIGWFRRSGGDILWLGIAPNKALNGLVYTLGKKLEKAGVDVDKRAFQPHITLARRVKMDAGLAEMYPHGSVMIKTDVKQISLMHSHRSHGRLAYTPLYHHDLMGKDEE